MLSMSFADDAPTLTVGLLRHGAGVDDTDMGFLPLSSGTDRSERPMVEVSAKLSLHPRV